MLEQIIAALPVLGVCAAFIALMFMPMAYILDKRDDPEFGLNKPVPAKEADALAARIAAEHAKNRR